MKTRTLHILWLAGLLLATPSLTAAEKPAGQEKTAKAETPKAGTPAAEETAAENSRPGGMRLKHRFLPTSRRIDREINKNRFVFKGETLCGLTISYGTLSTEDADMFPIFENIGLRGNITTVNPFAGYFYRDNNCVGVRFGYQHMKGELGNVDLDLGAGNDISMSLGGMALSSDSYSAAFFYRSYVGLDPKGRFGLFAELEASMTTGSTDFINRSGETEKATYSDNFRVKLGFNPGLAVYIFPNVCATVSIGLGGIQYNTVTQRDAAGNKTGSRSSSKMRFRLNIADINCGMVVHFWDKKKR